MFGFFSIAKTMLNDVFTWKLSTFLMVNELTRTMLR